MSGPWYPGRYRSSPSRTVPKSSSAAGCAGRSCCHRDGAQLKGVGRGVALWAQLMSVLGYSRFGAAGGDIGSGVCRYLGLDYPDRVAAVHRTDAGVTVFTGDPDDLVPE